MKIFKISFIFFFILCFVIPSAVNASKPTPDEAMQLLIAGNKRFMEGTSIHPNTGFDRLYQAGTENQGDHAYATVITCSDSRIPLERVFDSGIMDIFVIRVAGNVIDTDEAGSVEYGLAHVNTPVFVILGHTQCGAVTAVTHAIDGTGHALERNIPPLVDNIIPAVKRAISLNPGVQGDDIIPAAIIENVWQGAEDLFMKSPSSRNLVKSGKVKVVGAVYDVSTGQVNWLPELPVTQILSKVELNPSRAMNAMAEDGHGDVSGGHGDVNVESGHDDQAKGHDVIEALPVTLTDSSTMQLLETDWLAAGDQEKNLSSDKKSFSNTFWILLSILVVFGMIVAITFVSGFFARSSLYLKLYAAFGSMILLAAILGAGAYIYIGNLNGYSHLEAAFLDLDMMVGEASGVQNSFLLYGIENKEYGSKQADTLKTILDSFSRDLDDISTNPSLNDEQYAMIEDLRSIKSDYEKKSNEVITAYHEVEQGKEELDAVAEKLDETLENFAERHETALAFAESKGTDREAISEQTTIVELIFAAEKHSLKASHSEIEFLLDKNPKHVGIMEKELGFLKGYLKAIEHKIKDSSELEQLKKLHAWIEEYTIVLKKIIANEALIEKDVAEMNALLHKLNLGAAEASHEAEMAAGSMIREANTATVILILIVIFTGVFLAVLITRAITGPINTITTGMSEGADQVASAAGQVSSSSQSMAQGASEQAASIEETSSSMEEMSSMTKKNAENAAEADALMKTANSVVAKANQSMSQLTQSMEDISKASEETSKIIKTIDEIAFQTNLLALNAAVEAARAGEAGAGFAVVADEVRNLAMRAAAAAKDTAQLIEGTVKKVKDGSELVITTNENFGKVTESAGKVGGLVASISEASSEQANGIEQVNLAITEMDKVVQQNAANAEESASASEEMNAQAEQLREYVGDLIALINGKNSQADRTSTYKKLDAGSQKTISRKPKKTKIIGHHQKEIRPDQVIPFDDENFTDF